jgi:6-pyruvoyl-tetrahydropterin synthase
MDPVSGMVRDFNEIKPHWRGWLDQNYDHHMWLNPDDPLVAVIDSVDDGHKWGITLTDGCDPTVENFAKLNYEFAKCTFQVYGSMYKFHVKVFEAASNAAEYGDGV